MEYKRKRDKTEKESEREKARHERGNSAPHSIPSTQHAQKEEKKEKTEKQEKNYSVVGSMLKGARGEREGGNETIGGRELREKTRSKRREEG